MAFDVGREEYRAISDLDFISHHMSDLDCISSHESFYIMKLDGHLALDWSYQKIRFHAIAGTEYLILECCLGYHEPHVWVHFLH